MSMEMLLLKDHTEKHKIISTQLTDLIRSPLDMKADVILALTDIRFVMNYANIKNTQEYFISYLLPLLENYSNRDCLALIAGDFSYLAEISNLLEMYGEGLGNEWKVHEELIILPTSHSLNNGNNNLNYPQDYYIKVLMLYKGHYKLDHKPYFFSHKQINNTKISTYLLLGMIEQGSHILDLWPVPNTLIAANSVGAYTTSICHHERQLAMCRQQQNTIALGG